MNGKEEGGMVVKKGPRAKEAEAEDFFTTYRGTMWKLLEIKFV
jgi:hypothetical protein